MSEKPQAPITIDDAIEFLKREYGACIEKKDYSRFTHWNATLLSRIAKGLLSAFESGVKA